MTDQVVIAAVAATLIILILMLVGVVRVIQRRRGQDDTFGAGGTSKVPLGTIGVAKTVLAPSGVVYAAGEQWTARARSGAEIASGQRVRVVGQDGLTIIVDAEPFGNRAGE